MTTVAVGIAVLARPSTAMALRLVSALQPLGQGLGASRDHPDRRDAASGRAARGVAVVVLIIVAADIAVLALAINKPDRLASMSPALRARTAALLVAIAMGIATLALAINGKPPVRSALRL